MGAICAGTTAIACILWEPEDAWWAIGREFWRIPVGCGETGCGKGPDRFPLVPRIMLKM